MSRLQLPPGPARQAPQDRADELLNRLLTNPDDQEAQDLLGDIFGDVQADKDIRFGAPGTVERQDAHLQLWIKVMRLYNIKDTGYSRLTDQEVIDRSIRNATSEAVLLNLQVFVRGAVSFSSPRSTHEERPRFDTLKQFRDSASFWIQKERKTNSPSKEEIINAANQSLQHSARKHGVSKDRRVKTYLGRHELNQLIDWDTARTPFMPVTESHHLAWCMALICGVRPGSIGRSDSRDDQYLCFREIEITRGSERGVFNSKIQFLYLKGNRDSLVPEEGLTFSVNGAVQSKTLPMSIPHRLLVMLLRRGGLEAHSTVESLLGGDEHFIAIKDEFLDQPVCRLAGARGLSITEEAVSAQGLTNYLATQAMHAGYPRGITLYCWRRKAATTWMRAVGADRARQMLGHAHDSRLLEDHYEQGFFDIPVFEQAMREDTTLAQATLEEESSEVLRRMIDQKRLHGAFLNRQVNQILEDNKEYQDAVAKQDTRAMINLERRARDLAINAFHDERRKVHDKTLTQTEFEKRKADLQKPGELVQRIRQEVRKRMQSQDANRTDSAARRQTIEIADRSTEQVPEQPQTSSTDRPERNKELQELNEDADLNGDDLRDIDDDYDNDRPQTLLRVNADKALSWDDGTEETQDEFAAAVEFFMAELGKDRFYIPKKLICELCCNSPYRSEQDKNHVWPSPAKLNNHQLGKVHSKQGEIYLKLQYLSDKAGNKKFKCPYGDCDRVYSKHEDLVRHIKKSGPPTAEDDLDAETRAAQQLHDDEKRADGWYDDDFIWSAEKNKAAVLNANRRRNLGLQYTDEKELSEPREVVVQPCYKVIVGGGGDGALMTEIPAHYQDMLAFGDDEDDPYEHAVPPSGTVIASGDVDVDAIDQGFAHPIRDMPGHLRAAVALGDDGARYEHPGLWKEFASGD